MMPHYHHADTALLAGDVRVLVVSPMIASEAEIILHYIARFGGHVDLEDELFSGLAAAIDDPKGYSLFVLECDAFGGLAVGLRAFAILRAEQCGFPVILVSDGCREPFFSSDKSEPILLTTPLCAMLLRAGLEHALYSRYGWREEFTQ